MPQADCGVNTFFRLAYRRAYVHHCRMKRTSYIMVRATQKEREAAHAVAEARGTTVSQLLRAYLMRLAKKPGGGVQPRETD